MMKNLLWFQDPQNMSQNVISYNGDIITPPSNPRYIEKYSMLKEIVSKNKREITKNNGGIFSLDDGFFVKGHFVETDILGRNVVFMFYSDTKDKNEFAERLQQEARVNNKTCSDSLIEDIRRLKTSGFNLKSLIIAGLIMAMIAALLILINNK